MREGGRDGRTEGGESTYFPAQGQGVVRAVVMMTRMMQDM